MVEPREVIEKYYECPCCNLFSSYDVEKARRHICTCGYNQELPKKECRTCVNSYVTNERRLAGHARGHMVMTNFREVHCKVGCKYNHGNRCASYVKR